MVDLIFWWKPILQMGLIICSHVLYLNLKSFNDNNFSWCSRFQVILRDPAVIFSDFSNFNKFKR